MSSDDDDDKKLPETFPVLTEYPEAMRPMVAERACKLNMLILEELEKEGKLMDMLATWSKERIDNYTSGIIMRKMEED